MTSENVQVEQVDRFMADAAFDIAFRGDTDGIDEVMADLFARHRLAATRELVAKLDETLGLLRRWDEYAEACGDDSPEIYATRAFLASASQPLTKEQSK